MMINWTLLITRPSTGQVTEAMAASRGIRKPKHFGVK
jgi:hypothetical protein